MSNPIPVPVSGVQVEKRLDHGVAVVVVRDFVHIRAGYAIAQRDARKASG